MVKNESSPTGVVSPLSGFLLVLRQRVRRTVKRDLAGTVVLLALLLGLSGLLEVPPPLRRHTGDITVVVHTPFWVGRSFYLNSVTDYASRWLLMYLFLTTLLMLPLSALLGARSVPGLQEASSTAETLLTRLNAYEISLARLLAGLGPLLGALIISLVFWILARVYFNFNLNLNGLSANSFNSFFTVGVGAIATAHLVLVAAIFMVGASGALFASRSEPGAWWPRGAVVGFLLCLFCLGGIVLLDGTVSCFENPVPWIDILLLANPIAAISGILKVDILRATWFYQHTQAHDYPFAYPDPLLASGIYLVVGACCILLASWRMRHAYREGNTLTGAASSVRSARR